MKSLSAALLTQAQSANQAPVPLVAITGWGASPIRWNPTEASVVYGGNTYASRFFQLSAVELDSGGGYQRLTLSLANQDLALTALCDAASPIGAVVSVTRVFLDNLTVGQALASGLIVQGYRLTEAACELTCEGLSSLFKRQVPARKFSRTCPWTFKGSDCGYGGAETTCDYTDETCKAYGNFANFGGFLFVLPGVR